MAMGMKRTARNRGEPALPHTTEELATMLRAEVIDRTSRSAYEHEVSVMTAASTAFDENRPLLALQTTTVLRSILADRTATLVSACREAGFSWGDIGLALGVTAQAAHQGFIAAEKARDGGRSRDHG